MKNIKLVEFYRSAKWQKVAEAYRKSKHYICERCGQPANVVHHKTRLTPMNVSDRDISLSFDNLELLCRDCHEMEHNRKEKISRKIMFDADGRVVKVETPPGRVD